jgi:parvulin-like peptidyl-prolyl isomerase
LAKKSTEKPKKVVTRRQLSHLQRQKRRHRIILTLGISVIAVVVILVTLGVYFNWYVPEEKPMNTTVLEVNDASFDMRYFIDTLKYQLGDYTYYAQYFIDSSLQYIQEYELIKQHATEMGYSVTEAEIDERLAETGYENNEVARDVAESALLMLQLRDDYFSPQLEDTAAQRHVLAMFLESQAQVAEVEQRLDDGESFSDLAAELSLDSTTQEASGDLDWHPEGILPSILGNDVLNESAFHSQVSDANYSVYDKNKTKSLGYWLIKVLQRDDDPEEGAAADIQAILVSSEEEAREVLDRTNAGEEFEDLAEEYSQRGSEGSKANMGTIKEDSTMAAEVLDYIFAEDTQMGEVSQPIADSETSTSGGYWLYRVTGEEDREISEDDRTILINTLAEEWLLAIKEDPETVINTYMDDELIEFAVRKVQEA